MAWRTMNTEVRKDLTIRLIFLTVVFVSLFAYALMV